MFSPVVSPGSRRLLAFTLLELLIVIAIVAILSGMVVGVGRRSVEGGRHARARAELAALSAALESYKLAYGDYPRTNLPAPLLQSLLGRFGPDSRATHGKPLIDLARFSTLGTADPMANDSVELLDPWGNPYRYAYKSQLPWTNPACVLYSAGPDGRDTAGLRSGGFPDTAAAGNADNIWAHH